MEWSRGRGTKTGGESGGRGEELRRRRGLREHVAAGSRSCNAGAIGSSRKGAGTLLARGAENVRPRAWTSRTPESRWAGLMRTGGMNSTCWLRCARGAGTLRRGGSSRCWSGPQESRWTVVGSSLVGPYLLQVKTRPISVRSWTCRAPAGGFEIVPKKYIHVAVPDESDMPKVTRQCGKHFGEMPCAQPHRTSILFRAGHSEEPEDAGENDKDRRSMPKWP